MLKQVTERLDWDQKQLVIVIDEVRKHVVKVVSYSDYGLLNLALLAKRVT